MNAIGHMKYAVIVVGALAIAASAVTTSSLAAGNEGDHGKSATTKSGAAQDEKMDARDAVEEAKNIVAKMKKDSELLKQMKQAKGIFVMPDFGRAAVGGGVRGGNGVMLAHRNGEWSNPVFYNMGGVSIGPQAGASGGSAAMLLMSDKAVDSFMQQNNWSLNADAGLSIIDWSANAQGTAGKGDVVVWSDTEGLFAGADIGITDISVDEEELRSYYGKTAVTPEKVVDSNMKKPEAEKLKKALP